MAIRGLLLALLCGLNFMAQAEELKLEEVNIVGGGAKSQKSLTKTSDSQGSRKITRESIENLPSGNGDYTQLLRTNPNVQFSVKNRQSTTGGEIDPADVSINGAPSWQNNFTLDGVNMNNDLDPLSNKKYTGLPGVWQVYGSSSQGLAIDSDLLESVEVHDSNVSAKYGGFTGGVVEAKTRNPKRGFHGKASLRHTRDEWTQFHIHEQQKEAFHNSYDAKNQPRFSKWSGNLNLEGFVRDDLGLMFSYSRTNSRIPLKAYKPGSVDKIYGDLNNERVQRRDIQNYFLKAVYYANDRLTLTPSVTYAPQRNRIYRFNAKDSYMDMKSGGLQLSLKSDYELDRGSITQNISYQSLESSREAEHKYYYMWRPSNLKPWGTDNKAFEGGYGDIKQLQRSFIYGIDTELTAKEWEGGEHKITMGLEYKHSYATYDISQGFMMVTIGSAIPAGQNCEDEFCLKDSSFGGRGQFLTTKTVFQGKNSVSMQTVAGYIEHSLRSGPLSFRIGARIQGDDYTKETNLAPRFSSSYDLFGDGGTVFSFGANRYYGRNLFVYKLNNGRMNMMKMYKRTTPKKDAWRFFSQTKNLTRFSSIKSPYDDEISIGVKQRFVDFELGAKYLTRWGRDEIVLVPAEYAGVSPDPLLDGNKPKVYANKGTSQTQVWSVTLKTLKDLDLLGMHNRFELIFDRTKTKKHGNGYNDTFSLEDLEDDVYIKVDDKVIKKSEKPVDDFARPWTVRLHTMSRIPALGIKWGNFFSFVSAQDRILFVKKEGAKHNGKKIDLYRTERIKPGYTWDMRISYEQKLSNILTGLINLDVNNVLDRKNEASTESSSSPTRIYEMGRQFWLEAGVKW
ncbi:MAG: TonB-dependent receptor plug domain-containing protein [Wolinella sp.]